jgi:hypothetical protein
VPVGFFNHVNSAKPERKKGRHKATPLRARAQTIDQYKQSTAYLPPGTLPSTPLT